MARLCMAVIVLPGGKAQRLFCSYFVAAEAERQSCPVQRWSNS